MLVNECRQRHKMKNVILAHFKFYFGFLVFPFVSLLQLFCICLLLYCTSLYSLADTLRPIRVSLQSLSFYFYSFLVVQNLFVPSQFRYLCRSLQTFTFTFHVLFLNISPRGALCLLQSYLSRVKIVFIFNRKNLCQTK